VSAGRIPARRREVLVVVQRELHGFHFSVSMRDRRRASARALLDVNNDGAGLVGKT